ncbi:MAG: acyltransferase [Actinobacteria bacterium]|nr:acyltransferase [Actinomycetota bacterium]
MPPPPPPPVNPYPPLQQQGGGHGARLPYMPGVDGLRALAVATVFIFHAGGTWLPGGFLGVDFFLVISGYLITSLLVAEQQSGGRIDLWRFWLRRVRRLIPALLLAIAGTLVAMLILHWDEVPRLKGATLSAFAYVTNWYFIFADVPYVEKFGRPNVFTHLWSLAVEEQFYLFWPLVLAVILMVLKLRPWAIGVLAVAGAAFSTAWAWHLYDPYAVPWRIFYGTDTRAVGLFVGIVGAILLPPSRLRPVASAVGRWGMEIIGLAALAGVLWCMFSIDEFENRLYQGGMLMLAIPAIVLIIVSAHPQTLLGKFWGLPALVWIGARSYGMYLWHWPVLMLTRPGDDVSISGAPLVAIQIMLVVGISALSYRFVEQPIRRNGLAGLRRAFATFDGKWREHPAQTIAAWMGVVAVVALISLVVLVPEAVSLKPWLAG